jgi:hypothetical protein
MQERKGSLSLPFYQVGKYFPEIPGRLSLGPIGQTWITWLCHGYN